MKAIHYFSGITMAIFVGLHLLNHLLVLHSVDWHIHFMKIFRKVYRNPLVETVLLAAVLCQIITGILLVFGKWTKTYAIFDWLQIFSGLYMAIFLVIHVSAVLMGRYKLGLDTNLYFGVGYMNVSPQRYFFIPYYTLSILAFFIHIASVHFARLSQLTTARAATIQASSIIIVGVIITVVLITKMSNIDIPPDAFKKPEDTSVK